VADQNEETAGSECTDDHIAEMAQIGRAFLVEAREVDE
jgi:hypothetical protein